MAAVTSDDKIVTKVTILIECFLQSIFLIFCIDIAFGLSHVK